MNRPLIPFGIVFVVLGLGTGWLMVAHPEGLNGSWPLGIALVVPAAFVLGGLHALALGLGYPSLSAAFLKVLVICFLAIGNWAAFFTARVPCRQTASFFGVPILQRYPSELECRNELRTLIACVDAVVVLFFVALAWHKVRSRRVKPAQ